MATEKDLLSKALLWEKEALVEIYDRYNLGLYRYAMRLLGNEKVAEDCVAETFERFLVAIHRGGGPNKHLQAYLYRVAHNWISDFYKREDKQMIELDQSMKSEVETDQIVFERLEASRLRKAMALITAEQREILALKHLEGLKNKQVAEIVQKSVGAIKALEQRGLASLERILKTNMSEDA